MLIRRDFNRIIKSRYLQVGFLIVISTSLFMSLLVGSGIKFGISIFGNLTMFTTGRLLIHNGADYTKGLGLISCVLIAIFNGKEYQYKTFEQLIAKDISRSRIYFSKILSSIFISTAVFGSYQLVTYLILVLNAKNMPVTDFSIIFIHGFLMYTALATIICLFSVAINNYILSLIVSIVFIVLESNIIALLSEICFYLKLDYIFYKLASISLSGINEITKTATSEISITLVFSSVCIILISSLLGILSFQNKEF